MAIDAEPDFLLYDRYRNPLLVDEARERLATYDSEGRDWVYDRGGFELLGHEVDERINERLAGK